MAEFRVEESVEDAMDEIDAAVFSGDTFFSKEAIARLRYFLARWERGMVSNEAVIAEEGQQP